MAQEAFHYPDASVPNMSYEELVDHIKLLDERVLFDIIYYLDEEQRGNRNDLLDFLQENEPVLLEALQNIIRAYQTAHFAASEARMCIIRGYHRYRVARNTLAQMQVNLAEEVEKQAETKKPAQNNKKKKRARTAEEPEVLESEVQAVQDTAAVMKPKDKTVAQNCFFAQEKFTDDFDLSLYRHYVKKGHTKWQLTQVHNYGCWETIYHVNGPWEAERLVELLTNEGKVAFIVKKFRGGTDNEMMAYKVIAGLGLK